MTDRAQFEAMLEALINDDQQAAKEIFHNIVVGKSREIYEELLAEDFDQPVEEEGEEAEAPVAEEAEEEGDDAPFGGDDEGDDEEGEEGDEEGEENPFGDEEGGDEEGEGGDIEDRVMDLEDALDELKAEFEQLMAGEEGEEHMGGDEFGGDDMGGDIDMGGDDLEMEDELAPMMEYVDKVALPKHGDNGVNNKSAVAGKNDMGGTTANIAKSFSTEKGGTQGGLLKPTTQPQDGGNINKPGANAGKTAFKKKEPGHGAEKKGQAEKADNTNSMINGAPKRAK